MKTRAWAGCWFLFVTLGAAVSLAQSPRPDIAWFAGGHPQVVSVAYSPDGKLLASSGFFADTIKLWRTSDGGMVRSLGTNNGNLFIFGPMVPIRFLPDGRTIISLGEASGPAFWNVPDGKLLRQLGSLGNDLELSPDTTLIALSYGVTSPSSIKLFNRDDGTIARTIPWPSGFVQRVGFSLDGQVVAGGDGQGVLRTFRVADGSPLFSTQAHGDAIYALRYSPDGTRIATGSADHIVKLWNSANLAPMGTLTGHTDTVTSLAFSPDGALLASGSLDHTVKLWSMPGGGLSGTLIHPAEVDALSFNPTSTRLAVAAYKELREWDVASQTFIRNLVRANDRISGTVFTPDNAKLVSASYDGKVSVSDAQTGALLRQINAGGPSGAIFAIAANADLVAAGVNSPTVIKLYRLSDGALLHTLSPGPQAYPRSAAFSPDGTKLVTSHFGNFASLWNVADGTLIRNLNDPGFSGDMTSIAYTSDGSLIISGSSDGFVRVWDAKGNFVRSIGPRQGITSISISPDNQFVLAGGQNGSVQLWRIDNGASVYSFTPAGTIIQLQFTPSGFAFYAALGDRTLRIYRSSAHALLETYTIEAGEGAGVSGVGLVVSMGVSSDGKRLAYGRDEATVVMAYNSLIAAPTSVTAVAGRIVSGSVQDLVMPDGMVVTGVARVTNPSTSPLQLDIAAHLPLSNPTNLSFQIVESANVNVARQEVWMHNAQTDALELVDSHLIKTADQTIRVDLGANFSRFIDQAGNVTARVKWFFAPATTAPSPPLSNVWSVSVDQAVWAAGL